MPPSSLLPCLRQAHACSATVFALPAVQAVINFKWTCWARRFLMYELACYCLWLGAFTAFTLLFQSEDWSLSLWELLQDRSVDDTVRGQGGALSAGRLCADPQCVFALRHAG